jgi:ATP-dependent exoDNAse (exonuclease V) beta subunit
VTAPVRVPRDQAQRQAALDPNRSFIVQAPAGSGKTGLLTQRFLRLLCTVEQPEEILAITFTRKAAAEMRNRILEALGAARSAAPTDDWERQTWALARAALDHAEKMDWHLLANPQRLRLRTIDSLCQNLARQMPLRSGFGEPPQITEDARPLYRAAASSVLAGLQEDAGLGDALSVLLGELDNNVDGVHRLLAEMLERRDQWLPVLEKTNARAEVEGALRQVVEGHLRDLRALIPDDTKAELIRLADYAAGNLQAVHPMAAFLGSNGLPPAHLKALPAWEALAGWLLTTKSEWRRSVTVRDGFPPGKGAAAEAKQSMLVLLGSLQGDERLLAALAGLGQLPSPGYSDDEWGLVEALFAVLLQACAHLRVVFSEQGHADFCEVAMAANHALGHDLDPSDLALRLDYRLRHLLVDEFQDTSHSQSQLLEQLTAGWQAGDGRTLFLVGDPMQSIYGFRKAEVGLFLDAWRGRLGQVALEPLQLTVNFRSEPGVVDWVNSAFPQVFPSRADTLRGAVPYARSEAFRAPGEGPAVRLYPCVERDDVGEAAQVIDLIRAAQAEQPDGTVAVLVRSKAHLESLTHALRTAAISYQAIEIGSLAQRPAVMDLLALTGSLLHEGDRVSWLALLYGPMCGLTLEDLHRLAGADEGDDSVPLPRLLDDADRLAMLSDDGRRRAAACGRVVQKALDERGRQPLREWVEGTWFLLGGPATLPDAASEGDVEMVFRLLEKLDVGPDPLTPERLREAVGGLFAEPDPQAGPGLQLMTIHKAKGLEFDTVILPGLGKSTRGDGRRLLYWREAVNDVGETELFFGPVKSARRREESRTSQWIRRLESEMRALETGRLLYVAATRARRRLHLLGHVGQNRDGELQVQRGSLLEQLWPSVQTDWETHAAARRTIQAEAGQPQTDLPEMLPEPPPRWRLPSGWLCPDPPRPAVAVHGTAAEAIDEIAFEWAGDAARAVGTVVHRWLQRLVRAPVEGVDDLPTFGQTTQRLLMREGIPEAQLGPAGKRVRQALAATLGDQRGRWLLSNRHAESRCEFALTAVVDGALRRLVVDRTFVDPEGVRWIVDYKTGTHEGGNVEGFLDEEQERYRAQLQSYAEAFRQLENRRVRAALYYPLVAGGWREVAL